MISCRLASEKGKYRLCIRSENGTRTGFVCQPFEAKIEYFEVRGETLLNLNFRFLEF